MPKKRSSPRGPVRGPLRPEDLIEASASVGGLPLPTPEAIAALRKLVAHNDQVSGTSGRVKVSDAARMLQSYGWKGRSRSAIDRLCSTILGRRSYGTP